MPRPSIAHQICQIAQFCLAVQGLPDNSEDPILDLESVVFWPWIGNCDDENLKQTLESQGIKDKRLDFVLGIFQYLKKFFLSVSPEKIILHAPLELALNYLEQTTFPENHTVFWTEKELQAWFIFLSEQYDFVAASFLIKLYQVHHASTFFVPNYASRLLKVAVPYAKAEDKLSLVQACLNSGCLVQKDVDNALLAAVSWGATELVRLLMNHAALPPSQAIFREAGAQLPLLEDLLSKLVQLPEFNSSLAELMTAVPMQVNPSQLLFELYLSHRAEAQYTMFIQQCLGILSEAHGEALVVLGMIERTESQRMAFFPKPPKTPFFHSDKNKARHSYHHLSIAGVSRSSDSSSDKDDPRQLVSFVEKYWARISPSDVDKLLASISLLPQPESGELPRVHLPLLDGATRSKSQISRQRHTPSKNLDKLPEIKSNNFAM